MLRFYKCSFLYFTVALIFVGYHTSFVSGQNGTCSEYESGDNLWTPNCTDDNYWRPVQCKGETLNGRCFCYNATGTRLFGWAWWASAENMTCACSRRREALEDAGREDVSLHCSSDGNYEELQCDNGLCWCVEAMTGEPTERVYPESMMTYLPCYNATLVGSQYLRKCESAMVGRARVLEKLETHGRYYTHIDGVNCEGDGSYGHYKISSSQILCTWKNNTQIESYQTELSNILTVDCNCARDYVIYDEAGLTFSLSCDTDGSYTSEQYSNGYPFCVDSDGFATTYLGELGEDLSCT
ncbi:uncharacterized protein LOC124411902 [Diprion similis]|uniref:uncharacterized protein LOC124411902 n=1 Tax=Diprion similis TaxID=362088 RepID=UPI001EF83557|nr:uncharacterized protein LOC124411902 [Diprion similis]